VALAARNAETPRPELFVLQQVAAAPAWVPDSSSLFAAWQVPAAPIRRSGGGVLGLLLPCFRGLMQRGWVFGRLDQG